jgi:hypothetical protein
MSCCPTTYWCTAAGPVGVEADEDGVYTPPEGATSGPYATEEEAIGACPSPPFEFTIPCGECPSGVPFCTTPWEFPGDGITLSFVNKTGTFVALPNSIRLDRPGPIPVTSRGCASGACVGYVLDEESGAGVLRYCYQSGTTADPFGPALMALMEFCWYCDPGPSGGEYGGVRVSLTIVGTILMAGVGSGLSFTPATGWTGSECANYIGGACLRLTDPLLCGENLNPTQAVGTISRTPADGSADVFLTP